MRPLPSPPGLLVAGGYPTNTSSTSVEYWSPGPPALHCTLPDLPSAMYPTLGRLQGSILACYETSCHVLSETGWQALATTLHSRRWHTASTTSQGLLLVGGDDPSFTTTELVSAEEADTREGFHLLHERKEHCAIQLSDSAIVLTGGRSSLSLVTEYSEVDQQEATPRELASLVSGRYHHACGAYMAADVQVLS